MAQAQLALLLRHQNKELLPQEPAVGAQPALEQAGVDMLAANDQHQQQQQQKRKRKAASPRKTGMPLTKQPRQQNDECAASNSIETPVAAVTPAEPGPYQKLMEILSEFLFFDMYFELIIAPSILPPVNSAFSYSVSNSMLGPARDPTSSQILVYRCLLKQQLFRRFLYRITLSLAQNSNASDTPILSHNTLYQFFLESSNEVGLQFM